MQILLCVHSLQTLTDMCAGLHCVLDFLTAVIHAIACTASEMLLQSTAIPAAPRLVGHYCPYKYAVYQCRKYLKVVLFFLLLFLDLLGPIPLPFPEIIPVAQKQLCTCKEPNV